MIPALVVFGIVLFLLLFLIFIGGMLVNVGGQQVGIIERRFIGRTLPEGRVVAMRVYWGPGTRASARTARPPAFPVRRQEDRHAHYRRG